MKLSNRKLFEYYMKEIERLAPNICLSGEKEIKLIEYDYIDDHIGNINIIPATVLRNYIIMFKCEEKAAVDFYLKSTINFILGISLED